jgi:hypothetical protein
MCNPVFGNKDHRPAKAGKDGATDQKLKIMPRSVNNVASRMRRKRVLELAKGFFGRKKKCLDGREERR